MRGTLKAPSILDDPALRRGVYALRELTRYVNFDQARRLPASTVGRWARANYPEGHTSRRPDYSFLDLVTLLVVRQLLQSGLSMRAIRAAEDHLRRALKDRYPFARAELATDGVDVFFDADPVITGQLTAANLGGQEVLRQAIHRLTERVGYEHQLAANWNPVEGIVLNPAVQFGEPCIAGTRVTTNQVAAAHQRRTTEAVAERYRVDAGLVLAAVRFEEKLASAA